MSMIVLADVLLVQGCAGIQSQKPVCAATDAACLDDQVFLQRYCKIRANHRWEQRKGGFIY